MTTQSRPPAIGSNDTSIAGNVINKADFLPIDKSDNSVHIEQALSPSKNSPPFITSPLLDSLPQSAIPNELIFEKQKRAATGPKKGGEAGEEGVSPAHQGQITSSKTPPLPALPPPSAASQVTNAEFYAAVIRQLPVGAYPAVCSKPGDPASGPWIARRADEVASYLLALHNNYINCSSFYQGNDNALHARKNNFAACHFLMLDDIGTKIPFDRFGNFEFSFLLETSPGNFQGGIILAEPITDGEIANQLLNDLIAAGFCDPGATGAQGRWARLPVGINGKVKHLNSDGKPFQCRLFKWDPELVYTVKEIVDKLKLNRAPVAAFKSQATSNAASNTALTNDDEVFTPKSNVNPVITALKVRGLYKTPLGSGKHDVTCPLFAEHTDSVDTGAAYFEPDDTYPFGGFRCQHSHGATLKTKQFLEFLGIQKGEARNKPEIRIIEGDLHRVLNAAEKTLAATGNHYQSGGLIVTISTNTETGDPSIVPVNVPTLTRIMSHQITWLKFKEKSGTYVPCDPPTRHISILSDCQTYAHLPNLSGIARQPYFRESDGNFVTEVGYDKVSQRFGVFDARKFVTPEPTYGAARTALDLLESLLVEFIFVAQADKAASIAAIFTAVTRPSFAFAPGFHVKAATIGSGKSYLCELVSAFAKPGETKKVSYPPTSEEATKVILSLLISAPAVVEFDDMATDWIPHGIINRMFTSEFITDRILGVSKTATVSTRTLFLASGNNVGPVRDLLRRVLTINIDHRCATPATKSYKGSPVDTVRKDRGRYVTAVLTIILAWKAAGSPRTEVENVVTYGGAWADYCRHPLIWLGLVDPATALLEKVKHDPDADALLTLIKAWHKRFGSTPTTVRKVIRETFKLIGDGALRDAICEFPVEERGSINPSKFGWILKKNVNRIVDNYTFQQSTADGRVAWVVTKIS